MKSAIYIEDGVLQVVLTPETEHEKAILKLAEANNNLTVKRGSFYNCQGGWMRHGFVNFDQPWSNNDDQSLILVLREQQPEKREG